MDAQSPRWKSLNWPSIGDSAELYQQSSSLGSLVRYDLAIVRQTCRRHQIDGTLKLCQRAQRRGDFAAKCLARRAALRLQRHRIGLALARDHKTQPSEPGMTLADLRDLLGPHEH